MFADPSSSALSDPPSSVVPPSDLSLETSPAPTLNLHPHPHYRPAKQVPYQLREHCLIYFEEGLYAQSLTLLLNLLVAGTSSQTHTTGQPVAAFVPPHQHLSLAATLAVHPSLTTRASSLERQRVSNTALRLLRLTNRLLGPLNANLGLAFTFTNTGGGGLRRSLSSHHRRRTTTDAESPSDDEDLDAINIALAQQGSVWARAEDFWHVVGWAMNCSVRWPRRWERWKLWLEYMLEVLEADWEERERMNAEQQQAGGEASDINLLEDSLIMKYLPSEFGRYGGTRRIVRAIFADGSAKCLAEFREIFKNETLPAAKSRRGKDEGLKKLTVKVNIDQDIYGDYIDNDSSSSSNQASPTQQPRTTRLSSSSTSHFLLPSDAVCEICQSSDKSARNTIVTCNTCNTPYHQKCHQPPIHRTSLATAWTCCYCSTTSASTLDPTAASNNNNNNQEDSTLSNTSALYLRQRLLALLSRTSASLPDSFTPIPSLYSLYVQHLRPLPLTPFLLLLLAPWPSSQYLPPEAICSLSQLLLRSLLASNAPLPPTTDYDGDGGGGDELTQEILEECYLPFAANGRNAADNVKVALLVEGLLRLLVRQGGCVAPSLREAVERGCREREDKVLGGSGDGRGRRWEGAERREGGDNKKKRKRDGGEEISWLRAGEQRMRTLIRMVEESGGE